jgi:hypothetical protein
MFAECLILDKENSRIMTKKSLFRDEALEYLSGRDETDTLVTQPRFSSWVVLVAVCILIGTILALTFFVQEPVTVPGAGILVTNQSGAEAVFFVNLEQGKAIDPGMEVHIAPLSSHAGDEEFVYGNVISVSAFPVNAGQVSAELGSPDLAEALLKNPSAGTAPFEVRASLRTDPGRPGNFRWSGPLRYPVKMEPGTPVKATVITRTETMSTLLFGI